MPVDVAIIAKIVAARAQGARPTIAAPLAVPVGAGAGVGALVLAVALVLAAVGVGVAGVGGGVAAVGAGVESRIPSSCDRQLYGSPIAGQMAKA